MSSITLFVFGLLIGGLSTYFYFSKLKAKEKSSYFISPNAKGLANVYLDKVDIDSFRQSFYEHYSKKDDEVTRSVWFDRDLFIFIGEYLKKDTNVDGINAVFIKYLEHYPKQNPRSGHPGDKYPIPGQRSEASNKFKQTSIVFIPTVNGKENFNIWDLTAISKFIPGVIEGGGLNHGELCPDKCDHL